MASPANVNIFVTIFCLDVETWGTNFDKHLYELDGFKKILGPDIVAHLQNGTVPAGQPTLEIPDISVRIHSKESYAPLEGLRCQGYVGQVGNTVHMNFASLQRDVNFRFALDFAAERIVFDLFTDVRFADTGTAASAERIHEIKRFAQDYLCNGRLQITNTDTGELIGRKDPYIPLNMLFKPKRAAAELAEWKALAERRRECDRKFAEEMERHARGYDTKVTLV